MSGDNAVVGRPGHIGLPVSGSCWRTSIATAVRDMTLSPGTSEEVSREWGNDDMRGTIDRVDSRLGERGCDGRCD